MAFDLIPRNMWRFPVWDDIDDWDVTANSGNGLAISEDDQHVYIQAALPGVDPKDIEITFDKGVVWIKGEVNQEQDAKKFYRKAHSQFSYRVAVPGEIDLNEDPKAESRHGVMTVTFTKQPQSQPKKISVSVE